MLRVFKDMGPSPGVNWRAFSGWRFWSPRFISRFLDVSPQTPLGPARHAAFWTRSRATFPLEAVNKTRLFINHHPYIIPALIPAWCLSVAAPLLPLRGSRLWSTQRRSDRRYSTRQGCEETRRPAGGAEQGQALWQAA